MLTGQYYHPRASKQCKNRKRLKNKVSLIQSNVLCHFPANYSDEAMVIKIKTSVVARWQMSEISVKPFNMVVPSPSRHPFLALVNNASKGYREGDRQCFLIVQWEPRAITTRKEAPCSQKQPPIQNTWKTDSFSWSLPLINPGVI